MEIVANVPLSKGMERQLVTSSIKQQIVDRLRHMDLQEMKTSPAVVKTVCSIVEELVASGNPLKIDKKNLVVNVMTALFDLSAIEVASVGRTIDYLVDETGIRRASRFYRVRRMLCSFFCRGGGEIIESNTPPQH